MTAGQYRYSHRVDCGWDRGDQRIGLHDCRADRASLENGVLSLWFREGIWVHQRQEDGSLRHFYTGEAQVLFPLCYHNQWDVTVSLFTKEGDNAIREEYHGAELVKWLEEGSGKVELEFLYEYTGYQRFLFDCWLWYPEPPYHRECQLLVLADQMTCHWDQMREEKE